jgi:hypothetical protein
MSPARADNPCDNVSEAPCLQIGAPSAPGAGFDPLDANDGSITIVFDDSEAEIIVPDVTAQSIAPGDPNFQAAVFILSNGNTAITLGDSYGSISFWCDLIGVIAFTAGWEWWLGSAAIWAAMGVIAGGVDRVFKYFGADPPRSDANVVNVYRPRNATISLHSTSPLNPPMQAFAAQSFELSNAMAVLIATKERIEWLIKGKSYGTPLVSQIHALSQNAGYCFELVGGLVTDCRQIAVDLRINTIPSAPGGTGGTTIGKAASIPKTASDWQQAVANINQSGRLLLQAQLNPGPISLQRYDATAAILASLFGRATFNPTNEAQLAAQMASVFDNCASAATQMQTYLTSLQGAISKISFVGGVPPTSEPTPTPTPSPTRTLKGESPCTTC